MSEYHVDTLERLAEVAEKGKLTSFQIFSSLGALLRRNGWTIIAMIGNSELYIRPEDGGKYITVRFKPGNGADMVRAVMGAINVASPRRRKRRGRAKQKREDTHGNA